MERIKIKQVDAFTQVPHTGNPAGVVLDGKRLSERLMQSIAREMNLSETAFILPPTRPDAEVRLRWFTPINEVPLCGHATVASFHSLAEEGLLGMHDSGTYQFQLETASGVLPIEVKKSDTGIAVMMNLKMPTLERATEYRVELVRLLGIAPKDIEPGIPITRDNYLFVPIRRLHTLFTLKPNFLLMANFLQSRGLGGMCTYTMETVDRESSVHSRFFAPHQGINEDPVTGTAHGPLAILLFEHGALEAADGICSFQAEQGDEIGRRGRVSVELSVENNVPMDVRIGGNAVTVLEGEMLLSE